MKEDMSNRIEIILKETSTNKTTSTIKTSHIRNEQNSENSTIGIQRRYVYWNSVHASNFGNSGSKNRSHQLMAADLREIRNLARPFYQKVPTLNETIILNEDFEEEH